MPGQSRSLFGTDGVRGIAGTEITTDLAARVGGAFAELLCERDANPTVLLARDTRVSGSELSAAVAEALCAGGVRVADCGVLPTGALCLLVRARGLAGGVVVSSSHNPPASNGIKLVGPGGLKLPIDEQDRVAELVQAEEALHPRPGGRWARDKGAGEEYLRIILADFEAHALGGLRVLLDCAHGSAGELGPRAFEAAGATVETINCDPDGARINTDCGSTHPAAMAAATLERGADLGVAFDGDADRAVFATHDGVVVDGDGAKFVLATDLQAHGLFDPSVVVGTVMNNFGLERALSERGIELVRTPVGDRHVVAAMRETGARLGGEQSGHIIFAETLIGDGTYTALRVAEVVARSGRPLAELAAPVRKIPQLLMNVPVAQPGAWEASDQVRATIADWERRLDGGGRVLIRPSGTEPVVRIMVEADDEELAYEAARALAAAIAASR